MFKNKISSKDLISCVVLSFILTSLDQNKYIFTARDFFIEKAISKRDTIRVQIPEKQVFYLENQGEGVRCATCTLGEYTRDYKRLYLLSIKICQMFFKNFICGFVRFTQVLQNLKQENMIIKRSKHGQKWSLSAQNMVKIQFRAIKLVDIQLPN